MQNDEDIRGVDTQLPKAPNERLVKMPLGLK